MLSVCESVCEFMCVLHVCCVCARLDINVQLLSIPRSRRRRTPPPN